MIFTDSEAERLAADEMQRAWELYCEETAGDMHVADFWEELPGYVQRIYLGKVRCAA